MKLRLLVLATGIASLFASCGTRRQASPERGTESHRPKAIVDTVPAPQYWSPPLGDQVRHEMRAVWLTTAYGLDWPHTKADTPHGIRQQKEELDRILDRLVADGYNTVFFQARLSGSTTYNSSTEPFARVFTSSGERPDYDPLAYAVEACHRRGLAIHAWLVTYPLTSTKARPHPILQRNPSWAIVHKGTRHLDPGLPEVRTYIADLSADLVARYAVDGIHYDYFRYPEDAHKFNDRRSYDRYADGADLASWRRDNLTQQLREIQTRVHAIRPDVQISVAPLGKLRKLATLARPHGWTAYESVHQDVVTWAQEGLVDFVVPMMYYKDDLYEPFLIDWMELVAPFVPVVVGLAPYRVDPSESYPWHYSVIGEQIDLMRKHGAAGVSMFREANIGPRQPHLRTLIQGKFRHLGLPLQIARGERLKPATPVDLRLGVRGRRLTLGWMMPEETPQTTTYRVWVTTTHADGSRHSELLVQGLRTPSCTLRLADFEESDCLEFGVEAVNSFGVSTPCLHSVEFNLAGHRYSPDYQSEDK